VEAIMSGTFTVRIFSMVQRKIIQVHEEEFCDEAGLRQTLNDIYAGALQAGNYLYIDVIENFYPYRKKRIYGPRKGKK
jgi:hypothetical protein